MPAKKKLLLLILLLAFNLTVKLLSPNQIFAGGDRCPVGYQPLPGPVENLCFRPEPPGGCTSTEELLSIPGEDYCVVKSLPGIGENPCTTGPGGECETAIGLLKINLSGLANQILSIGIGVAGGFALILIVIGGIRVLMSAGDQQALKGGQEMIVAALAGLIFLIFATLILEFIGLNILGGVPGINNP